MRTTVAERMDRVTCVTCGDIVPDTRGWRLEGTWHCRPCAEEIMRLELLALSGELARCA